MRMSFSELHAPESAEPLLEPGGGSPPPAGQHAAEGADDAEARRPRRHIAWGRWILRGLGVLILLFFIAVGWLAVTAPLSRSLEPPTPPSITLLAADGTPIARRGAAVGARVDVRRLPAYVPQAFLAIEDRRFYSHWGVDPWGVGRAMLHNVAAGRLREGGSTITQQLAKNAFLDSDRTAGRKLRELLIAFWLEAWLSKEEILSRYLSNVYFGDNVYGLSAAARHYFSTTPDHLTTAQAAMLAGLVKAPSKLAPTGNPEGARERAKLVVAAMAEAGYLTRAEADATPPARLHVEPERTLPTGSYFADWVEAAARDRAGAITTEASVTTTLETRLQRAAERAIRRAGLKKAQAAIVAMRPDGRIVAMVGGRDYGKSPFNRATQARRQPGSAFKLFVYLAALRSGMTPQSTVEDKPVTIDGWHPRNADGQYRGTITLREAFARSSNVAAARLTQRVGVENVIRAARDLGVSTPLPKEATIALGTANTSLLELTAAYAAVAAGAYPVRPHGLDAPDERRWLDLFGNRTHMLNSAEREGLRTLLAASINEGTGRQAALDIEAFGKTGTSQDSRDALFMGYARDLVVGVWVGNDDNSPNPGLSGGGVPARIWRDFMSAALGVAPRQRAPLAVDPDAELPDGFNLDLGNGASPIEGEISGFGLKLKIGHDGSLSVDSAEGKRRIPLPPPVPEPAAPAEDRRDLPR